MGEPPLGYTADLKYMSGQCHRLHTTPSVHDVTIIYSAQSGQIARVGMVRKRAAEMRGRETRDGSCRQAASTEAQALGRQSEGCYQRISRYEGRRRGWRSTSPDLCEAKDSLEEQTTPAKDRDMGELVEQRATCRSWSCLVPYLPSTLIGMKTNASRPAHKAESQSDLM